MSDQELAAQALEAAEAAGSSEQVVGDDQQGSTGGTDESELPVFADGQPFTFKYDDGEEVTFSKRGELLDFMRHSDYRKKRVSETEAKLKAQADEFAKFRSDLQNKQRVTDASVAKALEMDKILREKPWIADIIVEENKKRQPGQTQDLDPILDERLKPLVEFKVKYEAEQARRAAEERQRRDLDRLAKDFPDANRDDILAYIQRLQDTPEEDGGYSLYRLIHYAMMGERNPAEIEQKLAEAKEKKDRRPPSVTSTPGRATPTGGADPTQMTRQERADAALKMLGGK